MASFTDLGEPQSSSLASSHPTLDCLNRRGNLHYSRPLNSNLKEIRLLQITSTTPEKVSCNLTYTSLQNSEPLKYRALSYVWGKPVLDWVITVNGRPFKVTENLYEALRHLYKDQTIPYWIDDICINQDDPKEKGEQVQQMTSIYSKSVEVIIWLGPANNTTPTLMEKINKIGNISQRCGLSDISSTQLREWPWFERVWVLQELVAGSQAII
ncbi:hypothetical protein OIDMADRAFT_137210, partial [Oidiodendron maius Zn]